MSASDFDFILGRWAVRHERLADPFDPECTTWTTFETSSDVAPILGGLGTADETVGTLDDGRAFNGFTLRLYSPDADEWAIWWASAANPGVLDDPVRGRFHDGVGTFVGPGERDGIPFLARFHWIQTATEHPAWEQDFSFDGGETWAPINWRMVHTRVAD